MEAREGVRPFSERSDVCATREDVLADSDRQRTARQRLPQRRKALVQVTSPHSSFGGTLRTGTQTGATAPTAGHDSAQRRHERRRWRG
eukprot:3807246-Pleurochrysis_carterae.AAC.1